MPGIPAIQPYAFPTTERLPSNMAAWHIEPRRAVLLVHDMQGYFLSPLPEPMRGPLIGRIRSLRERCVKAGIPVAYTMQPGRMTDNDRGLLRDFWGPGMRTTAADRDVVQELTPGESDWLFTKWRYSAFFRSDLLNRMRDAERDQLILCGVYAHVGVLMSAVDAFTNDIQPFLVADAVADFSEDYHRQALQYTAERCGYVLNTEAVVS